MQTLKTTTAIALTAITLSGCGAVGPDKFMHAAVGLGIAVGGKELGMTDKEACAAAIAIGIAKEIIDPIFSIPDVIATSIFCIRLLKKKAA